MKINLFLCRFILCGALSGGICPFSAFASSFYDGEAIVVQDGENTLKTVAQDVGDDNLIKYDEVKRQTLIQTSIVVDSGGTLSVGDINKDSKETLLFNCAQDGKVNQYGLTVQKGGQLNICNAEIGSLNSRVEGKSRTEGNRFKGVVFNMGTGRVMNSRISGAAVGIEIKGTQKVEVKGCEIVNSGIGIRVFGGWGSPSPFIKDCRVDGCDEGMRFENDMNKPEVENCDLRNNAVGILMTGDILRPQRVPVLNVELNRTRKTWVTIHKEPFSLVLKWMLTCSVLNGDGSPLSSATVRVTGINDKASEETPAVTRVDEKGMCGIVVTEAVLVYNKDNPGYIPDVYQTKNRIEIDVGNGYKTVKDNWTPAGRTTLIYTMDKERESYSETTGEQ